MSNIYQGTLGLIGNTPLVELVITPAVKTRLADPLRLTTIFRLWIWEVITMAQRLLMLYRPQHLQPPQRVQPLYMLLFSGLTLSTVFPPLATT